MSRQECEFQLLQYVPDPVRNEFVHVGVILRQAGRDGVAGAGGSVIAVKFTSDWRRVKCLDPEADTGMLEGLETELRRRFELEQREGFQAGSRSLMQVLEDSFSNAVQLTGSKAYLAESVEAGVEELMRMYVETPKRERGSKSASRLAGRAAIQLKMRTEFERVGVWDLLRKRIGAAQFTRAGDPLRIDLGYRALGSRASVDRALVDRIGAGAGGATGPIRMFQAVSLEAGPGAGVETAKGLAFSAAALRAGVERAEGVRLELTAVVEPLRQGLGTRDLGLGPWDSGPGTRGEGLAGEPEEEWLESYRFAVETMEEHSIRVMTTADLGRVAETARLELILS